MRALREDLGSLGDKMHKKLDKKLSYLKYQLFLMLYRNSINRIRNINLSTIDDYLLISCDIALQK